MHILVLPSWYPSEDDPIRGAFFAEQAQALARYGHKVSVIPLHADARGKTRVERRGGGNFTEFIVHYGKLRFHLTFVRSLGALRRIFREYFKNDRPDIIHVHSFQVIRYARALKALYGIPYVVTEHVSWFERGMISENRLRSISADYAGAAAVIAVGAGLKEQIQPLTPSEVMVVPNLVSQRFFEGELHAPAGETFDFISVGNLDKNKGMDVVITAFSYAAAVCPRIRLTICGKGTEYEALRRQAEELGISDKVTFTGQISREEVAGRMRASQAFVLASRVETFGVVFVEAMACGLPIAMTETGAWRELITPRTGLVAPVDDAHALSGAMVRLAEHSEDYDSREIREYCREKFSEESVCRRLTEIYERVLERD